MNKGWFKAENLTVSFTWEDYQTSLSLFESGIVDAVAVTNGDALTLRRPCSCFLVNDYSFGNDKVISREGINSVNDLIGRRVGLELGLVTHLLFLAALKSSGIPDYSVEIVNISTNDAPIHLQRGFFDAIVAWQPHSGRALRAVKNARQIFTSRNAPGLIYDMLCVDDNLFVLRNNDWKIILQLWDRVTKYIQDPTTMHEALHIMSTRVSLYPQVFSELMSGTKILGVEEARMRLEEFPMELSVRNSTENVYEFFLANGVTMYQTPAEILEFSLIRSFK